MQDNESLSRAPGTVRGLHFQVGPHAQGKLIRAVSGSALDVAVDLRPGSPTLGDHLSITLDADEGQLLWLPAGFAHGFCTLTADTVIQYKVTDYYSPDCERTLRWDEPRLGIDWPPIADPATMSDKDARGAGWDDLAAAGDIGR